MALMLTMGASISHIGNRLALRNCTLWKTDSCPACRAVMMCLDAMHLRMTKHEINMEDLEDRRVIHSINPIGTLPVFKHHSLILSDSHAITSYLVNRSFSWASSELLPSDQKLRMRLIQQMFYNSSVLNPLYREITKPLLYKENISVTLGQLERVQSSYKDVEKMLSKKPYLGGNSPSLGDILLCAYISTLDIIVPVDRNRWPELSDWMCRMSGEKFFKTSNQKGLENFAAQIGEDLTTPDTDPRMPPMLVPDLRRTEAVSVLESSSGSLDCPHPELTRMNSKLSRLNSELFRLKMRRKTSLAK